MQTMLCPVYPRIWWRRVLPLFLLLTMAQLALAGPAPQDLPNVKMPAIVKDHPRLVFRPEGKGSWTFARLRHLYEAGAEVSPESQPATSRPGFEQARSLRAILKPWLDRPLEKDPSPAACALRYHLTGNEEAALRAIEKLQDRPMEKIGAEYYSDGWEYALAYDWLYDHPAITPQKRKVIEGLLVANAKRALELLNDDGWELSPSMWHGRTKITNLALVVCLSLDTAPEAPQLQAQIAGFFGDTCRALRLSEGWPEGYAYWLGNRSFPFAVGVDCWRTATGKTEVAGIDLIEMIRRTDLWHVYGQRPDSRLLLYGDVFQGVRMNYPLRAQTMDYYARITADPHLQAFAINGHLQSPEPYYNAYRWMAAMAFDPSISMPKNSTAADPMASLKDLPLSDLFGAGAYNLAIFRTGWQPADTLVSFKAGDVQVHHAHYDAGTFTIDKGGPLAALSGTYAGFGSEHRQRYYVQSVAANCPLVLMPGEVLETHHQYDGPFTGSGGQRVVWPGGSDIQSAAKWRRDSQVGHINAAGKMIAYTWQAGQFGYVAADLTCAYNSEYFSWPDQKAKIRSAVRALVYLPEPETVLVYDRIVATSADYQKKWLLHTINKPEAAGLKVLKGKMDNGILATEAKDVDVVNMGGAMRVQALLPTASRWLLLGGPDYRFYVETDGDQKDGFDGQNPMGGYNRADYFDNGNWRLELEPTTPAASDDFLVSMALGTTDNLPTHEAKVVGQSKDAVACQIGSAVVLFAHMAGKIKSLDLEVLPVAPVRRVIACTLGEAKGIPVDAFEPVLPNRGAALLDQPDPLPAGKPVRVNVSRPGPDEVKINVAR